MTKIATKVQFADGTIMDIGTRGNVEKISISMHSPTSVDWTSLTVTIQDISGGTVLTLTPDQSGAASAEILLGHIYEVQLPTIDGYVQPISLRYTASLVARPIDYTYSAEEQYFEQLDLRFGISSMNADVSVLNGYTVSAVTVSGTAHTYSAVIQDGVATITGIPYGSEYQINLPTLPGWKHDHNGETHTAGVPSREIVVDYWNYDQGVFGITADGHHYTASQIETLIEGGVLTADDIVAAGYTDDSLENADRGDGTNGCGFCWKINSSSTNYYGASIGSYAWASSNVEFDTAKLPFRSSNNAALEDMAGSHNTSLIIQIGKEFDPDVPTPAATAARSQTLTIGGVDKQGFVLAYGQIYRLRLNMAQLQNFYAILGKTAPPITSGNWWTSCQFSATNAVYLGNGGFSSGKTFSYNVFCAYDL